MTQLTESDMANLHSIINSYITKKTSVALSSLISEPIKHYIQVLFTQPSELQKMTQSADELVLCSIFLKGEGEVRLGILYTINEDDAKKIASKLLCMDKMDSLTELGISAISEVSNIMSGSFFNALSENTGYEIELSTPGFALTTLENLLQPHAVQFVNPTDSVISRVEFEGEHSKAKFHMLIIQDPHDAKKLLVKNGM